MAMMLQEAINSAVALAGAEYGTITEFTVSMHDGNDAVLAGGQVFETYGPGEPGGKPTFHPDLPLRNWGPATLDLGLAQAIGGWSHQQRPVPGFSTRGQGGMTLNAAAGGGNPIPVDVSVRRDAGVLRFMSLPGLGPGVQMEIEKLSGPGGTAISGVTLEATEDGALLRAVGPSLRDPATNASYTVTIIVIGRPG
jgi:hypothetical protein